MKAGAGLSFSDVLIYGTVALAPLPFGSVDPVWISVWCFVMAASLGLADLGSVRPLQLIWLAPSVIAFGSVLVVVFVQQWPLYHGYASERFWQMSADAGSDVHAVNAASLDPGWRALGPSLLFVLTFGRAFLLASNRDKAERLYDVVIISAAVYACYGLLSAGIEPGMLLGRVKQAYLESVTGTFVNRNTAATYFGSAATLWFLRIARDVRRIYGQPVAIRTLYHTIMTSGLPKELRRDLPGFGICFGATLATSSRAGTVLTIGAIVVASALWARPMPLRKWLLAGVGVALLIGAVLQIWGDTLINRFETRWTADVGRAEAYAAVVDLIRDFPWFGIGLGQFEFVFPAYRANTSVAAVWDKAHSVPLELAAELGIPVATIVGVAWLIGASGLIRGLFRVRSGRIYPIGGLAVGLLTTGHAVVDFSLQIPGFAVFFAAVMGICLAQSVRATQSEPGRRNAPVTMPEQRSARRSFQASPSRSTASLEQGSGPKSLP